MSMDRELAPETIKKRRLKILFRVIIIIVIFSVGIWALRAALSPDLRRSKIMFSTTEIGVVESTLTASGVVVPEIEQIITSPVSTTVENVYRQSGDSVAAGDIILALNKDILQMSLKELSDELEMLNNRKQQLRLEMQREQIDLQTSYEIKNLETQFRQAQYNRVKHLFDIGAEIQESLDRAALNVEIANRELEQLDKQINNQDKSLEAELKGLDIEISIQQNRIDEVNRNLGLSDARASRSGVVTWVNDNIGGSVSTGDIVAKVADLGSFEINGKISDIHAGKLSVGGPVRIRIAGVNLDGQIGSVNPVVENGVITFIIRLDDRSHHILRPNLRADVYVVTNSRTDVVRVKNGPFYRGEVDQEVFVLDGDRAVRRQITTGVSNFDFVELQGDIEPGEEVIISDMRKYRHMGEVTIENDN